MTTKQFLYRPSERVSNCVDKLTIQFLKLGIIKPVDENAVRNKLQIEILRAITDIQADTFANSQISPSIPVPGSNNLAQIGNILIPKDHLHYVLQSENYLDYHMGFYKHPKLQNFIELTPIQFHEIKNTAKVKFTN